MPVISHNTRMKRLEPSFGVEKWETTMSHVLPSASFVSADVPWCSLPLHETRREHTMPDIESLCTLPLHDFPILPTNERTANTLVNRRPIFRKTLHRLVPSNVVALAVLHKEYTVDRVDRRVREILLLLQF